MATRGKRRRMVNIWEDGSSDSVDDTEPVECVVTKIKLPDHIAACYESRELLDDVETIDCDHSLMNQVMGNYIIAKRILSHLEWQDKLICKLVCTTWNSAIKALCKEQLCPADFVMDMSHGTNFTLNKSELLYSEPMAVFGYSTDFNVVGPCNNLLPCPCDPPCEDEQHHLVDVLQQHLSSPKNCMLTVLAEYITYFPLPHSITSSHSVFKRDFSPPEPILGGIFIPVIPEVEFHVINIMDEADMKKDFFDVIDKLSETKIFKGVLVYVTEKSILNSIEDINFLGHIKKVQPDIPYALGGCLVKETVFGERDILNLIDKYNRNNYFISENFISIGVFTVPKISILEQNEKCNFEMYSLVLEVTEFAKAKIEKGINDFANTIPRFEHSVGLKLSCVGRDQKHDIEQEFFRAAFPDTPLVGCFGNGELGINHPIRTTVEQPKNLKKKVSNGILYSYSTVFVYIGWGRTTPPDPTKCTRKRSA